VLLESRARASQQCQAYDDRSNTQEGPCQGHLHSPSSIRAVWEFSFVVVFAAAIVAVVVVVVAIVVAVAVAVVVGGGSAEG